LADDKQSIEPTDLENGVNDEYVGETPDTWLKNELCEVRNQIYRAWGTSLLCYFGLLVMITTLSFVVVFHDLSVDELIQLLRRDGVKNTR
jgi:hypothetical protein